MFKRLSKAIAKLFFCHAITADTSSFLKLIVNTKRLSFQKNPALTANTDPATCYQVRLPAVTPLFMRTYAGDIRIFYEIFLQQVYRVPGLNTRECRVIIDAGANIGLASLYFNSLFPLATIYAVEPSQSNFRLLEQNVRTLQQQHRIKLIHAALSDQPGTVRIENSGFSYNAKLSNDGDEEVAPITMRQLLDQNNISRVDFLKIDIEGAELQLFQSASEWLHDIHAIIVEIHSSENAIQIRKIVENHGFCWRALSAEPGGCIIFAFRATN